MTQHPDLFTALAAPFESHEVKVRTQAGRQLHYVTARTIMNRLDNVIGPESWWDEYEPHENSVLCRLTIRLPDGSTLTKADAGGYAGMADSGDDDKSGYSDAFKRAAVKFGVSRYLYRDGVPMFVQERTTSPLYEGEVPNSPSSQRPTQHQPRDNGQHSATRPDRTQEPHNGNGERIPRSGKALFAWVKNMEQQHQINLLKYLNGWAKLQELPSRMVDWSEAQVGLAYTEAMRKIAVVQPSREPGEDG